MDFNRLCKGCFREKPQAGTICPFCGFDELQYEHQRKPEVLPINTVLRGAYLVGRCIGKGGFGITYIGWHLNLDTVVAIKEFFPAGVVFRDTTREDPVQSLSVTLTDSGFAQSYRKALESFIKEAKTLGNLRFPGVVRVYDCFEENRTAYIVMDYIQGQDVSGYLKQSGGKLDEVRVLRLMHPVIQSLRQLHDKGIIHRDISPDNLLIGPDGTITLVDFGAARVITSDLEGESAIRSMTVVLKPGYAPMEQYNSHGNQGPWTDIYALCATLYRMLTGQTPDDPGTRSNRADDEQIIRKNLKENHVSGKTVNVLVKGLQLLIKDRYQSMRELESDLYSDERKRMPDRQSPDVPRQTVYPAGRLSASRSSKSKKNRPGIVILTAALLMVVIIAGSAFVLKNTVWKQNQSETQEEPRKTTETEEQKITAAETQDTPEAGKKETFEKESQEVSEKLFENESQEATEKLSEKELQEASEKPSEKEPQETSEKEALEAAALKIPESVKTGDTITFGHYEQDNNLENGKEDIEWIVLDRKEDRLLVISKYGLDAKTYNTSYADVTWETCDLRGWLNDEFYQEAFSTEEQNQIEETAVAAEDNVKWGTEAGNDTWDKIFLLSISEAGSLFENADSRACYPTEYTKSQGVWTYVGSDYPEYTGRCHWWLRSPGGHSHQAAGIYADGEVGDVSTVGGVVNGASGCVRPALWINPGSGKLSEKVSQETSEEEASEPAQATVQNLSESVKTGDTITFGHYEQDNNLENGKEEIEWIVLDKKDEKALLISKYGLDAKAYNTKWTDVTWETCELRGWLNDTFCREAFSEAEKQQIEETAVINEDNEKYHTSAGNDTIDRVFLLSTSEAENLFTDDTSRICYPTLYAEGQGGWTSDDAGTCWWWLRSPGLYGDIAAEVRDDGLVYYYGDYVIHGYGSVRPALWINLETENPFVKEPQETSEEEASEAAEAAAQKASASAEKGDIITLGCYEQDNNFENGEEDIEWIVLDRKEDRLLVISKYGLDVKDYNSGWTDVTWETCGLRGWLNDTFYQEAFSGEEKRKIEETDVINEANEKSHCSAGNDTVDRVFLLSISEAENLFTNNHSRVCYPTAYAEGRGVRTSDDAEACTWWLRSPGINSFNAADVNIGGSIFYYGDYVNYDNICVRPALWINLGIEEDTGNLQGTKNKNDPETVKKVQQALNDAGFSCGTPDGVAGTMTDQAIIDFKAAHGLDDDTADINDELLTELGLS